MRYIARVAAWLQGTDACSMLAPFMLPEAFVVALIVLPVCVHVVEEVRPAGGGDYGGDVCVLAVRIAELVEGTVTMIWPGKHQKVVKWME